MREQTRFESTLGTKTDFSQVVQKSLNIFPSYHEKVTNFVVVSLYLLTGRR